MANEVNIGTMDTLVTVQSCTITKGREAAKSYNFQDFRQVYANVELLVEEQVNSSNLDEGKYINLTIYKIPQLTTRWRVIVDGRSYEITGINPISRISPFCILTLHAID